jgi:DNA-binding NtrC family response regulator
MGAILVVEDDWSVRDVLTGALADAGHVATGARTVAEAIQLMNAQRFDLIVADLMLPDGTAAELIPLAQARGIKVLIISGHVEHRQRLHDLEVPFLFKPFRLSQLIGAARRLVASERK